MNPAKLRPLGIFAAVGFAENADLLKPTLKKLAGQIAPRERRAIVEYLRSGTCIDAWMGISSDLIEDRFRVEGGDAIDSDGTWFWRSDTADYVEHYGIGLPEEFLEAVKSSTGTAPVLAKNDQLRIFNYLRQFYEANSSTEIISSNGQVQGDEEHTDSE